LKEMPFIDADKCNKCGLCISVCSCGIFTLVDNCVVVVEKERCRSCNKWCTQCEFVCPTGAVNCYFEVVIE